LVGVLIGMVGLMAACYKTPVAGTAPSGPPTPAGPSYSVRSGQATVNGGTKTVLIDAQGFTLYFRSKDSATSVCSASCANVWPPLLQLRDEPTAGPELNGTLRVSANANGNQLVYNNHPLYRYSGDVTGGQATGQGTGGIWFVAEP